MIKLNALVFIKPCTDLDFQKTTLLFWPNENIRRLP